MMSHALASAFLALLLASPLSLPAQSQEEPLLPPAAPVVGIQGEGTRFNNPILGPKVVCANVERQFAVLNPNVVVGEPVYLRLILRPVDPTEKAEFVAQLNFGADLQVIVQPPGRIPPYSYEGERFGANTPSAVVTLNEMLLNRLDFRMVRDEDTVTGAAFDIPGTYKINVRLNCVTRDGAPQMQDMGQFIINVSPATGDDERAMNMLNDPEMFLPLQLRVARLANGKVILSDEHARVYRQVVDTAPKAAIRPHLMVLLAEYNSALRRDDQAVALFQQIQREYPNTPFSDEALYAEQRLYLTREQKDKARDTFLRIWQHPVLTASVHPLSVNFRDFVSPYRETVGGQWMLWQEPGPDPESIGTQDSGLRIQLSPEVQQMLGLPEYVTPEQLRSAPIPIPQQ